MAVESLLLTAPLYLVTLAIFREPTAAQSIMSLDPAGSEPGVSLASRLTLAVGAGIYEELVFRLIAVSLLHLIVTDLFKGGDVAGAAIAVIGSAALFAAHHYWPASRSFAFPASMPEATFYFAAGLYFAAIFHFRGFGVVAGVHIAYDVLANL
jgi:membrane protease YdiL (CAAX protease family)